MQDLGEERGPDRRDLIGNKMKGYVLVLKIQSGMRSRTTATARMRVTSLWIVGKRST